MFHAQIKRNIQCHYDFVDCGTIFMIIQRINLLQILKCVQMFTFVVSKIHIIIIINIYCLLFPIAIMFSCIIVFINSIILN